MGRELTVEQAILQKDFKNKMNLMVDDISLMESNRMNMNDLVRHYMRHRKSELKNDDYTSLEDRYNILRNLNKNSYCKSCTVEVSATSNNKCPFCGLEVTPVV